MVRLVGFTREMRRKHRLCSCCALSSVCKLVPRSLSACDAFYQRRRHRREHGSEISHDKW